MKYILIVALFWSTTGKSQVFTLATGPTIRYDTLKVIMLVADTSHNITSSLSILSCEESGCKDTLPSHAFVSHFKTTKTDRGNGGYGETYWMTGYAVEERSIYSLAKVCYLDTRKKALDSKYIVWMSKVIN